MIPYLSYSGTPCSPASLIVKKIAEKNAALMSRRTVAEHREAQKLIGDVYSPPKDISLQNVFCAGVPCEWAWKNTQELRRGVVLYLHGGSWAYGTLRTIRPVTCSLAAVLPYRVLAAEYRLAPEYSYPAALDDAEAVYRFLLDSGYAGHEIALFGDSAGGNLSLALLHRLRDAGLPQPACCALASPVTDLRESGPVMTSDMEQLFTLVKGISTDITSLCFGEEDRSHPHISPVSGDLVGFPPLLVHCGEDEAPVAEDNLIFAEKAYSAGVPVHLKIWTDMFHDFTVGAMALAEGKESMQEMAEFIQWHLELPPKQ